MGKPHLQIIIGSVREGRRTGPLAHWAAGELRKAGKWTVEVLDLADWAFPQFALAQPPANGPYQDRLQRAWGRTVRRGDAYVIAAPEYNHGYTGVVKTALDYLYGEWLYKPVSVLTFGNAEGARMTEALQQVFVELGMVPSAPAAHIRSVYSKTTGDTFTADDKDAKAVGHMADQLLVWRERLRNERTVSEGPRVLVIGRGEETIQSVVEPLQVAGVRASGQKFGNNIDGDYDVISFGRGTLGQEADALKASLRARLSQVRIVDTIAPIAVRQIESELALMAGEEKALIDASSIELRGDALAVTVTVSDACRLGVTAYTTDGTIKAKRLATVEATAGTIRLTLPAPKAVSVVIDADGAELRHHAVPG